MSLDDVLAELRKTYLEALPARADLITKLHENRQYVEVETEFHKLKGTGKTYGLPEVTAIAEIAEQLVDHGTTSADTSIPAALNALRKVTSSRTSGSPLDLSTDPDFLFLSDLVRTLRDTSSTKNS